MFEFCYCSSTRAVRQVHFPGSSSDTATFQRRRRTRSTHPQLQLGNRNSTVQGQCAKYTLPAPTRKSNLTVQPQYAKYIAPAPARKSQLFSTSALREKKTFSQPSLQSCRAIAGPTGTAMQTHSHEALRPARRDRKDGSMRNCSSCYCFAHLSHGAARDLLGQAVYKHACAHKSCSARLERTLTFFKRAGKPGQPLARHRSLRLMARHLQGGVTYANGRASCAPCTNCAPYGCSGRGARKET